MSNDEHNDWRAILGEPHARALLKVAEVAAVLFRPPYRRLAGMPSQEQDDFRKLYEALCSEDCPVEIGEEFT